MLVSFTLPLKLETFHRLIELLNCFGPQVVFVYHARIVTKYIDLVSLREIASDIFPA